MPDYTLDKAKFNDFLKEYTDPITDEQKYMEQLVEIANRKRRVLEVEIDDVAAYQHDSDALVEGLETNTRRYTRLLAEAADEVMPEPTEDLAQADVVDVLHQQRQMRQQQAEADAAGGQPAAEDDANRLPAELMRRYEVVIRPRQKQKAIKLREVSAEHIGKLVRVQGIVTQVTDVKPLLTVATYLDDASGFEVYQEVT
ncbi:hypothetical protein WJX81_007375, partial [Elliptochloris bilobata]